ncbi:MAG: nucleotidyltransferase domain-containing protein [Candidatus Njordarchaeota archaeon]
MALLLKKDLDRGRLVKILTQTLLVFDDIIFAYLYGSLAKGNYHKFSDVDVAVYLKRPSAKVYLDILGSIEIDGVEVDLKILNDAPPIFRYRVIKDGILLLCRDEALHENFVFHTLIEALEFIEVYRKLVRSRVYQSDL